MIDADADADFLVILPRDEGGKIHKNYEKFNWFVDIPINIR
jgi:hypothetical protein